MRYVLLLIYCVRIDFFALGAGVSFSLIKVAWGTIGLASGAVFQGYLTMVYTKNDNIATRCNFSLTADIYMN